MHLFRQRRTAAHSRSLSLVLAAGMLLAAAWAAPAAAVTAAGPDAPSGAAAPALGTSGGDQAPAPAEKAREGAPADAGQTPRSHRMKPHRSHVAPWSQPHPRLV